MTIYGNHIKYGRNQTVECILIKHAYCPWCVWRKFLPIFKVRGQGNKDEFEVKLQLSYRLNFLLILLNLVDILPLMGGSSGGVVVKLLAWGARGPGFDSPPRRSVSQIGYLPLPSRDMAEISLKRRKSLIQPTNQPTNLWWEEDSVEF